MNSAERLLQKRFRLVRDSSRWLVPGIYQIKLEHCPLADSEHEKVWRQHMHYRHKPKTICYAAAVLELPRENQIGLIAHELGHAAAFLEGFPDHTERDAQQYAEIILNSPVTYEGPHELQHSKAEWLP